ncbi:cyclic pyranopterin monophosphate synthase subunit MoaA [Sinobacterium caligoides]|uniref:GTP 3',8-cyclase n=1 Tax=Sinobacterium caligoides TaxID=933926 RepID=A0A3N2DDS7_9GAMM|nr:GTP 3',8-cyclase MoaA [Sinobacterium caligoides]ROR97945.1 cyclic pyranopterin monophosphate synthase subunit MoaA [Sinobacterium caligoides]
MMNTDQPTTLIDRFNRRVDYVRMSVTDRCDFRCVYCMAEEMTFLPREQILSLEEIAFIARAFVELGVSKIRLTGGEPLIRRNAIDLFQQLGRLPGLKELNLTSNGSQLPRLAQPLVDAGTTRINISLDTLDADKFKELTRTGDLHKVLAGIDAAIAAGFQRVKLNAVILKGRNDDEILDLVAFAIDKGVDITFIEEMPLGDISEHDRALSFCSSDEILAMIEARYSVTASTSSTPGPSRYYQVSGQTTRIGFISPHSHNFCDSCNRVRVTVEGRLLLCLGNEHSVDLRQVIRSYPGDMVRLKQAIIDSLDIKPERHHFDLSDDVQIVRFMNTTGG